MFLFQIDFRDTLDSLLLTRAWLESDLRTVKRFDSRFKKKEKGLFNGSVAKDDSCRSIQKFLSKQGKTISHETIRTINQS